ncbi:cation:proton antiporter [Burkholderia cenocepacia]|uniref:cation:proton antiporter n=1 Tax=Burkholderia cenocepacia TaxID=95486 RepID=UPI0028658ED3|nr:cation:proton antiporter [Burkholderia cenocepacia]MDR8050749.1 cation:proton antiporter [Burkholderia cenocepacia]MDV3097130.1 cation:proton antiporter [Burkholderia cenocepacia]
MWLIQIAIVIIVCFVCGEYSKRLGQCKVIGEIAGGILLGPLALGAVTPSFQKQLFTHDAVVMIGQLGEVGLALLMFEIGLEISVPARRAVLGSTAIAVSGIVLPFAGGVAVAWISYSTLAPQQPFWPYILLCGVALSVSAVPVMACIVQDLELMRHPGASVALSSAMIGDVIGWCALSAIVCFSRVDANWRALGADIVLLCAYVLVLVAASKGFLSRHLARTIERGRSKGTLTFLAAAVLVSGWITSKLGFHSAFGALVLGTLLRHVPGLRQQFQQMLGGFVHSILMPVFFANAGLHMQLFGDNTRAQWYWLIAFIVVGFIGKYLGVFAGARLAGYSRENATVSATLMNARGLMELIFLSIGLEFQILPTNVYTMLMIFALFTTAMTAPLLRRSVQPVSAGAKGSI